MAVASAPGLCHTGSLYHWRAVKSGVAQTVEAVDVYPVPVFRVFFKKLLSGQKRVAISGRAFRVVSTRIKSVYPPGPPGDRSPETGRGLLGQDLGISSHWAIRHRIAALSISIPGGIGLVSQGHLEGKHAGHAIFNSPHWKCHWPCR